MEHHIMTTRIQRRTDVCAEPLVSVVTPFYNTAPYLAECIESVIAQTYSNFEYVLVDNCSTDGSREIALNYARRDERVRVVVNDILLDQVANYNHSLEQISPLSAYCKIVQADDLVFPECLRLMVDVAERDHRIGLVSSYYLFGDHLDGSGVAYPIHRLSGLEACRQVLRRRQSLTGSPTTVMYRADLVRSRKSFYPHGRFHEDTDTAFDILLEHDLGYVHQVLSFSRRDNPSLMTSAKDYNPLLLHYLQLTERYGARVLTPTEFATVRSRVRRDYFDYLGQSVLRFRSSEFWTYHRTGLASIGWELRRRDVLPRALAEVVRLVLNPLNTLDRAVARLDRILRAGSRPTVGLRRRSSWKA